MGDVDRAGSVAMEARRPRPRMILMGVLGTSGFESLVLLMIGKKKVKKVKDGVCAAKVKEGTSERGIV